jgi:hypothetical protein
MMARRGSNPGRPSAASDAAVSDAGDERVAVGDAAPPALELERAARAASVVVVHVHEEQGTEPAARAA